MASPRKRIQSLVVFPVARIDASRHFSRVNSAAPLSSPKHESPASRLVAQVEFIAECDKLKEIFRQTNNTQSRRPENDAEHSWHLCLCVIVLAEHANTP